MGLIEVGVFAELVEEGDAIGGAFLSEDEVAILQFDEFAVGDVGEGADDAVRLAIFIERKAAVALEPAEASAPGQVANFMAAVLFAPFDERLEEVHDPIPILRV
jgi:hypothetical protein